MKKFLKTISIVMVVVGLVFIIGVEGAGYLNQISIAQMIVQGFLGIALLFGGAFLFNIIGGEG